jgi:hypothetical protein
MSFAEFQKVNGKGTKMVNAVTPATESLSVAGVTALFNQVAICDGGNFMQSLIY